MRASTSLVAPLRVLLVILGHTDKSGHSDRVQLAENLYSKLLAWVFRRIVHHEVRVINAAGGQKQTTPTHLPPPRVPREAPRPPRPPFCVVHPPPRTEKLINTYVGESAVWKISIPLVLNLGDLAGRLIEIDLDFA